MTPGLICAGLEPFSPVCSARPTRLTTNVGKTADPCRYATVRTALIALAAIFCVLHALGAALARGSSDVSQSPILQRFLSNEAPAPVQYRALRHLDARNDRFDSTAWMDVWTEADSAGRFTFDIVAEGGSEYIRSKVFLTTLDVERGMWASGAPDRAALTPANYVFEDRGAQPDGLASLGVMPRRKDMLLIEGTIFVRPDDGDLVRVEGRLAKAPSFWTRRVDIVRSYQRFVGVRLPVALESVATVLIAGRSTLQMNYEYETVNGQHVGNPRPRLQGTTQP